MIGVISDDLTGAAELGAVGLRYGLVSEIVAEGESADGAELVCVDTASRSQPREEAAARAANAARLLNAAGAEWIYKKVDSVLRGHVIAEVEAVMKQLRLNQALVVPANPLLGRVIREGRYFVRGRPIDETEFAADPEHPRKSSSVLDLLGRCDSFPVHLQRFPGNIQPSSIGVAEAATPTDLQRWAGRMTPQMLAAGGAEYFAACLAARGRKAATGSIAAQSACPLPELFICGSASASSCEFAAAAKQKGNPVFSLPSGLAQGEPFSNESIETMAAQIGAALRANPRVILNIGIPVALEKALAPKLLADLGALAERVVRSARVEHIFAEGGSTAAELVRRMGWKRLKVLREEARGVVTLAPQAERPVLLTMKPGSYVWPGAVKG